MMPRHERGSVFNLRMVRAHKAPEAETVRRLPRSCSGYQTRGRFVGKNGGHSQKVAVNVSYKKFGFSKPAAYGKSLRGNAVYITRNGVLDAVDEKGNRLSLDDVHTKTHGWDDDQRYYKIILSPEEGLKMDLEKFTTDVMARVTDDLLTDDERNRGVQIEWVMAQHWDTDHPHVHVMMRANVEGRDVRLSAGYASHGIRSRAEEIATGMLGYRVERWQDIGLSDEQKKERANTIIEANRPLLMARREEQGLNPETGKHPDDKRASEGGKALSKSREADRDTRSFDGGIE